MSNVEQNPPLERAFFLLKSWWLSASHPTNQRQPKHFGLVSRVWGPCLQLEYKLTGSTPTPKGAEHRSVMYLMFEA